MLFNRGCKYLSFILISTFVIGCSSNKHNIEYSTDINLENNADVIRYGIAQNKLNNSIRNIPLEYIYRVKININEQGKYDFKSGAFDVFDEVVYFLDKQGDIYVIDTISKKIIWRDKINFPAQAIFRGWIKVVGNIVVVIGNSGIIAGHNKYTGARLWHRKMGGDVNNNPQVYQDSIIFQQVGMQTVSINAKNGDTVWTHNGSKSAFGYLKVAPITIKDNIAYILYSKGEIFAVDAKNGNEYWSRSIYNSIDFGNNFDDTYFVSQPLINGDKIYVASSNKGLYVINRKNGRGIWRKNISSILNMDKLGKVLFILDAKNKVYAIDIDNGNEYWSLQLHDEINKKSIQWNNIIIHRGRIILLSEIGKIQLLSLDNGKTIAIHKGSTNSITPIKERALIYILQNDGYIKVYR